MALRNFSNVAAETSLSAGINSAVTSITVGSVTGYPTAPFTIVVDADTIYEEIMLVTAVGGSTFTVTRGYNGTTALAHTVGAKVKHAAIAIDFTEANAHVNATTTAHGVADFSALATKTGSETFTNKTMSGLNNTFSNIPYSALTGVPAADVVILNKTASYTPVAADDNALVVMNSASAQTITLPSDATAAIPIGGSVSGLRFGTGTLAWVAGAGASVVSTPGLNFRAQYSFATALKIAANTWLVTGDVA